MIYIYKIKDIFKIKLYNIENQSLKIQLNNLSWNTEKVLRRILNI